MRKPFLAALAAAVLVVPVLSRADTLNARFPALATELQNRKAALELPPLTALERRQKSAIKRATKPLAADTNDLAKTLVNERLVLSALDPSFKADATVGPMLEIIVSTAQLEVAERNLFSASRAGVLPEGKDKKRANASIAAAARAMTIANDDKRAKATRFAYFSKALAADVAAEKTIRKVLPTLGPVLDLMECFVGDRYLFAAQGTQSITTGTYDSTGAGSLIVTGGFESGGARRNVQFRIDAPGVGPHAVVLGSESFYFEPGTNLPATTGTVTITNWDPANHKCAGKFEVTYSNGTKTLQATKGEFSFVSLQTM